MPRPELSPSTLTPSILPGYFLCVKAQEGQKITAIVRRLKRYKPERVILFGSYAWGRPAKGSDVDLLIVKKSRKRKQDRLDDVNGLLFFSPIPVDALVYTPEELNRRLKLGDFFFTRIVEEGQVIYDRKRKK